MSEMRIAGYYRVSTEEQAKGLSPETQIEDIRSFCDKQGWPVVKIYGDPGDTGTNMDRPGFIEMLDDAKFDKFDRVISTNIDRFSREPADAWPAIRDLLKINVTVSTIAIPGIDSSMKEFKLVFGMVIGQAAYFIDNLREGTRKGLKKAREKGKHIGRAPSGFEHEEGILVPTDLGKDALRIVRINPKVKAIILQKELKLADYKESWSLLKACKKYLMLYDRG